MVSLQRLLLKFMAALRVTNGDGNTSYPWLFHGFSSKGSPFIYLTLEMLRNWTGFLLHVVGYRVNAFESLDASDVWSLPDDSSLSSFILQMLSRSFFDSECIA